jgi:adenylate kinase
MNPERVGWFSAGKIQCDPLPPLQDVPHRLVVLGPPGVGKGTQAQLLCERLRTCHLSTGDLFRSAKCDSASSPAMNEALNALQRGELISDELVIAMVRERSMCLRCQGGFLLDGFPRTVRQAVALEELLAELHVNLDTTICFELPLDDIVARLSGRRTCSSCQAVFHVSHRPPTVPGVCDHCRGRLVQRDDDQPEAICVRMRVYKEETQPLIDFYQRNGKLQRVQAVGSPQEIFDRTMRLLGQHRCALAECAATESDRID